MSMTLARVLVVLLVLVAVRGEAAETVAGVATKARAEAKRIARVYPAVDVRLPPSGWTIAPGDTTPRTRSGEKRKGQSRGSWSC